MNAGQSRIPYRLGIDVGTSGVRVAVLDPQGRVKATARAAHDPDADHEARAWWRAVVACVRHVPPEIRAQVGRIAVDGTSGSVVLTDAALRPVSRALLYNSSGFGPEAARIGAYAPDPHITRGPASTLARVLHLLDQAADPVHLMHQADYITARMRGQGGVSDFNNALKTGFDPDAGGWPKWIPDLGVPPGILPRGVAAGTALGPMCADAAQKLGLPVAAQVHAGTTDSIAGFLAAAPLAPGVAVTSLGTTLAVKLISPVRIDAPEIGLYSHRLGDHWLVGGASNTGGGVLAEFFTTDRLAALSARIDPDHVSPFDYYPLTRPGERFPTNDPTLPPRLSPRPSCDVAFLHGMLESIARIEARCYAQIAARGGPRPNVLYTVGGGAQNAAWTAIRTRVLGLAPQQADHAEAAVGAARLTALG